MLIASSSSIGSRIATAALFLLLFAVPVIAAVIQTEDLQSALLVVVAILVGSAVGWLLGEGVVGSALLERLLALVLVVAVIVFGLVVPAWTLGRQIHGMGVIRFLQAFFAEPFEHPSLEAGIRYGAISLLITAAVAAALFKNNRQPGSNSTGTAQENTKGEAKEPNYQAMIAWGTVLTAGGTGVAVLTVLIGLVQLMLAESHWQKEVTIRALGDESWERPVTSRHCLRAANSLEDQQMQEISLRRPVRISGEKSEYLRRCFADHDDEEQKKYYVPIAGEDAVMLSAKGANLLAQRVNYALERDGMIASLLKHKIANRTLVTSERRVRICEYDRPLVLRFQKLPMPELRGKFLFREGDSLLWLVTSDFCAPRNDEKDADVSDSEKVDNIREAAKK